MFKRKPKRPGIKTKKKAKKTLKKAKAPIKRPKVKWDYTSPKYVEWRNQVYRRDSFTCRVCGKTKVYIEAHHICKKSKYPALAYVVSNGITLCKNCHDIVTTREEHFQKFFNILIKNNNKNYDSIKVEFIECLKRSM